MLKYLPDDINVEDILSYLPKGTYRISIDGLHKRNSYKDIIAIEKSNDAKTDKGLPKKIINNAMAAAGSADCNIDDGLISKPNTKNIPITNIWTNALTIIFFCDSLK